MRFNTCNLDLRNPLKKCQTIIDPKVRLDESNKGPSRDDRRSLAAATAALGADPRTPRPLVMGTPHDENAQMAARYQRLAASHFARTSWGFQKLMEMNGVDFSDAPAIPEDVADILAPVPAPLTAPNPETNPPSNPPAAASESGDADNPTSQQPDCEAHDAEDSEESPPSPPSPTALAAAQRCATRASAQHDVLVREKSTRARMQDPQTSQQPSVERGRAACGWRTRSYDAK